MTSATPSRLPELVSRNAKPLLASWRAQQRASSAARFDLISNSELDDQSKRFLASVEAALNDPSTRYVLLTAEPGAGKTGFLANLAAARPQWARYFIRRDSAATVAEYAWDATAERIDELIAQALSETRPRRAVGAA